MKKVFYVLVTTLFIATWFLLVDVKGALFLAIKGNWGLIFLALLAGFTSSLIASLRLKFLISIIGEIPYLEVLALGWLGGLISLILPFYVGGFSMAYLVSKKLKISYLKSFTVLFLDFAIGVLPTLILGIFSVIYFVQKKLVSFRSQPPETLGVAFLILLLLLIFFLVFVRRFNQGEIILRLKRGAQLFSNSQKKLILALFLNLLAFFFGLLSFYLYFLAFGLFPGILDFALAGSILGILGLVPGAFAKIGQYETFGVITLPFLLGLDKNGVFAVLLISHAISITTTLTLGLTSLYLLNLNFSKIGALFGLKRDGQN
ncbi:hypothetical protein A2115_01565 [Candidatus Woesebacteria bacterium GWA1_41_8]|uniref:Flippase-like domain-containing protein n=1 Tax=Candidatus Woesebacteria bacterium GWA1_41_8 TaxID=1802471 RepID=A0A1F7WHC7_9BACT|nr:MAG: hypothetical protein A2115_01565 [Candidatus Woesebacteria bacterium GWA1_41_8]